jgi:hypothetical protein
MTTDITMVLTVFAIVATNLVTVITLYIHTDNKMNTNLKAIADEMKDFHERLIRIEERRTKILEK